MLYSEVVNLFPNYKCWKTTEFVHCSNHQEDSHKYEHENVEAMLDQRPESCVVNT